jgi:hypothetical protein
MGILPPKIILLTILAGKDKSMHHWTIQVTYLFEGYNGASIYAE